MLRKPKRKNLNSQSTPTPIRTRYLYTCTSLPLLVHISVFGYISTRLIKTDRKRERERERERQRERERDREREREREGVDLWPRRGSVFISYLDTRPETVRALWKVPDPRQEADPLCSRIRAILAADLRAQHRGLKKSQSYHLIVPTYLAIIATAQVLIPWSIVSTPGKQ